MDNDYLIKDLNGGIPVAKGKRTSRPRFWLILAFLFAVGTAVVYGSQAYFLRYQNETLAELAARQTALSELKTAQERKLEFMDSDEYIIREARDTLGLLMPGEILFEDAR